VRALAVLIAPAVPMREPYAARIAPTEGPSPKASEPGRVLSSELASRQVHRGGACHSVGLSAHGSSRARDGI